MAVYLNALGIVCALGRGPAAVRTSLFAADAPGGLTMTDRFSPGRVMPVGLVTDVLPGDSAWPAIACTRNNRLAAAALADIEPAVRAACAGYGAARVAVILGGSTSGMLEGEAAVAHRRLHGEWPAEFDYQQQELGATANFVAAQSGAQGPAHVISTACSSGAKALSAAARLLNAGLADAVIAGGVDTLCRFTEAGFAALESVSARRCNPLSAQRDGIHLGEGAALFLMTREPGPVRLSGWGESSDAHHMSAPEPNGRGALQAMQAALDRAGLAPAAIDYVNLHGTATPQNDAMEGRAVHQLLGSEVASSSTKPLSGHALGAAGALEAGFAWLTLVDNARAALPPHWWDGQHDPAIPPLHVVQPGERLARAPRHVLSNSFAFGGSNACLVLSAE
jgi:3-oxoacyl-[acyl-carrier-protein] synthase-1